MLWKKISTVLKMWPEFFSLSMIKCKKEIEEGGRGDDEEEEEHRGKRKGKEGG
jgi:hypothetical protein